MRFKLIKPTRNIPREQEPTFVLVQDDWNDYSFQTLYHLHLVKSDSSTSIGALKILKRGQTSADYQQVTADFESLGNEFVSVGTSLDYYEHLSELGIETRNQILDALRDVAKHPELEADFSTEEGWNTSLFRDQSTSDIRDFLQLAQALTQGDYTSFPADSLKFSFHMSGWDAALTFDFTARHPESVVWFPNDLKLPGRLIVLIGRNGSGKSTLLARMARVAHSTAENRAKGLFDRLGAIEPQGIGFPRIITVSYSAFDSFALPGVGPQTETDPDERKQIVDDTRRGEGRFVFCGLRDIASELEQKILTQEESKADLGLESDRVDETLLKSIDLLAAEFSQTIALLERKKRLESFGEALDKLVTDSSFSQWEQGSALQSLLTSDLKNVFLTWSTGQKIVLQIVASLAAHITPRSLVLIDEPETHLHPPLVAALMHAVRHLLTKHKAFGIVATHSPVVLQESMARNVFIIRREGQETQVFQPTIQTFGENVGSLTSEVFGLNSEVTDFHTILNGLVTKFNSLEAIEKLFVPHGLSLQARAYVMSQLAKRSRG